MKKTLLILASSATVLFSCSKELDVPVEVINDEIETIDDESKNTVTIFASINKDTKSTVTDEGVYSWTASETIAVADETTTPVEFTAVSGKEDQGVFSGSPSGDLRFAVSPASAISAAPASGTVVTIEYPSNYDYVEGKTNVLMVAGAPEDVTGGQKFVFHQAGALLKFSYVNAPVGTKKFRFTADKNIVGTKAVDASSTVTIANTELSGGKSVTITLPSEVSEINTDYTFYVPVPTGSYQSFKVELLNSSDEAINTKNKAFSAPGLQLDRADMFISPVVSLPYVLYCTKVTSVDGITSGDRFVIASKSSTDSKYYALPVEPTVTSGKIDGDEINVSANGILSSDAEGYLWTFTKDSDGYFTISDGTKKLYHANGGNSGTNLAYGTGSEYASNITKDGSGTDNFLKFAGVVLSGPTVKTRGMLMNNSNAYGGYSLSNYNDGTYTGINLYKLTETRSEPSISWSSPTGSITMLTSTPDTKDLPTLSSGGLAVKYYSSDESKAIVNKTTGEVTAVAAGTPKIIARFTGDKTYKAKDAEYTLTITDGRDKLDVPTFSKAAGSWVIGTEVTISGPDGATIYYTIDGSTPTTESNVYSSAIIIDHDFTLKAIAVKDDYKNSNVASAAYTIPVVATPSISITDNTVTISCETDGATIYYTIDSTTPTSSSTVYSTSFSVLAGVTVKAFATKTGYIDSSVSSAKNASGAVTVSMDTFTTISGNVDGDSNVTYEAAKGAASTAPAVNSNEIRIYQNGGLLTITANNSKTIKSVTIGSSMATKVQVSINSGSFSSDHAITASGTYTEGSLSANTVQFKCTGTDKTSRLYLNYLSVTYE